VKGSSLLGDEIILAIFLSILTSSFSEISNYHNFQVFFFLLGGALEWFNFFD